MLWDQVISGITIRGSVVLHKTSFSPMLYACEKQAPHANIYVVITKLSCQPEFKERIKKKLK
jgi:hypothetical protein